MSILLASGNVSTPATKSILFSGTLGTGAIDYDRWTFPRNGGAASNFGDNEDSFYETWIRPTSANDNTGAQWVNGNIFVDADSFAGSPVGGQYGLSVCNNTIRIGVGVLFDETYSEHTCSSTVNDSQWHHIAWGFESSTGMISGYIDGQREFLTDRGAGGNMSWVSGGDAKAQLTEGGGEKNDQESGNSLSFFGHISETRVRNIFIDSTTIIVPTGPMGIDGDTICYWPFDDGSGTNIRELVDGGNSDGTVVFGGDPEVPEWSLLSPYT